MGTPGGLTTSFASFFVPPTTVKRHPSLSGDVVNPPEVQKVVVEHIVKTENAVSQFHGSSRLRAFSGKTTRPSTKLIMIHGEVMWTYFLLILLYLI